MASRLQVPHSRALNRHTEPRQKGALALLELAFDRGVLTPNKSFQATSDSSLRFAPAAGELRR